MIMKEIDFLPEWYKSGRRRQVSYCTQCIVLSCVFAVMMIWSFFASHSISKAKAEFAQIATDYTQAESVSSEFAKLESEVRRLQVEIESMEETDSKIDVASVLAEMSYLVGERTVLNKVEFVAEKFVDRYEARPSPRARAVVRVVRAKSGEKRELPLGDVRFKVVMAGVAADASDVMALTCKLEDSPYFCQVIPSVSRNAEISIKSDSLRRAETGAVEGTLERKDGAREAGESIQVSEFEINCYLANYREQ
jgi:hypothetical protein